MSHIVTFSIPERKLGKADIEFKIKSNGRAFGTLKISKGALVLVPLNKQYGYKLDWTEFNRLAQQHGREGHM